MTAARWIRLQVLLIPLFLVSCGKPREVPEPNVTSRSAMAELLGENEAKMEEYASAGMARDDAEIFLRKITDDRSPVEDTEYTRFLRAIAYGAKENAGGHIDDPTVVTCLVIGVGETSTQVQKLCVRTLLQDVRRTEHITPHVDDLIAAWDNMKDEDLATLIGRVQTDRAGAFLKELEKSGELQLAAKVKARFGSAVDEQKMILEFENETDARKKADIGYDLAYVGSTNCVAAIASAMRSPMTVHGRTGHYSLRYDLIRALATIYPDEDLFGSELQALSILDGSPSCETRRKAEDAYIDRVEKWCEEHADVQWTCPRPATPLFQPFIGRFRR
jgi:hypothetical protein